MFLYINLTDSNRLRCTFALLFIHMLQHFHILTLTHRFASLKDIGQLVTAFDHQEKTAEQFHQLKQRLGMEELFYVGTCNRVMLFFTHRGKVNEQFKASLLADENTLATRLAMQHYQGDEAFEHLFAVASSIDSLVVGERQILGQLRDAYERCREWGLCQDDLRMVFDRMVVASKDVYASTRIGEKSVSIVSLAVKKMLEHSPQQSARILVIGAGKTNTLVGKFLKKYDYQHVTVFNRSEERANQLAATFEQGRGMSLQALETYQEGFDVLFVCTGAVEPVITSKNIDGLLAGEPSEDKIIIDLSVPNNVAEDVANELNFGYIGVEHLKQLADENVLFRTKEIEKAQLILKGHIEEMTMSYRQRLLERALQHVPTQIKEVKQRAVEEVFAKELEQLDPSARELMEKMLNYMEKKCIGIPMKTARENLLA